MSNLGLASDVSSEERSFAPPALLFVVFALMPVSLHQCACIRVHTSLFLYGLASV